MSLNRNLKVICQENGQNIPQNKLAKSQSIVYERTVRQLWQSEILPKKKKTNRLQWATEKQSWGVDDQTKMMNDGFALAKTMMVERLSGDISVKYVGTLLNANILHYKNDIEYQKHFSISQYQTGTLYHFYNRRYQLYPIIMGAPYINRKLTHL